MQRREPAAECQRCCALQSGTRAPKDVQAHGLALNLGGAVRKAHELLDARVHSAAGQQADGVQRVPLQLPEQHDVRCVRSTT